MRIGIVGHGVVGSALARFLSRSPGHSLVIYDKFQAAFSGNEAKEEINRCELVFLCVPTPTSSDGFSCDLTEVEECVAWIAPPLCIRSTVPPGTVDRLAQEYGRQIAFSPEYLGESSFHPWKEEGTCGFLIVGGPANVFELVRSAYQACSSMEIRYSHTIARTAETCKYMENCFLATKVAFVNQFYDIAQAFDVDFEQLRNLWLMDPRIGESHTMVTGERGFRGRCLPKDIAAIIDAMKAHGGAPLLEAVLAYNRQVCEKADSSREA